MLNELDKIQLNDIEESKWLCDQILNNTNEDTQITCGRLRELILHVYALGFTKAASITDNWTELFDKICPIPEVE